MFNKIEVTRDDCKKGDKVVRGKDWRWHNQDGGEGSVGIIEHVLDGCWARIRWSNGLLNYYRIGAEECYDLYFYTEEITDSLMHRIGHLLLNKQLWEFFSNLKKILVNLKLVKSLTALTELFTE